MSIKNRKLVRALSFGVAFVCMQTNSWADNVINDDLIVTFSTCIGNDCINGESFGFDTLRLKENNLRIKFQDTSNSASFPSADWQLTANGTSNGGENFFAIDSIDNGRTPFKVEYGAGTNSLYIDDKGDVGFGTSSPVVNLHVVDGNTPTLRLEQMDLLVLLRKHGMLQVMKLISLFVMRQMVHAYRLELSLEHPKIPFI